MSRRMEKQSKPKYLRGRGREEGGKNIYVKMSGYYSVRPKAGRCLCTRLQSNGPSGLKCGVQKMATPLPTALHGVWRYDSHLRSLQALGEHAVQTPEPKHDVVRRERRQRAEYARCVS